MYTFNGKYSPCIGAVCFIVGVCCSEYLLVEVLLYIKKYSSTS